MAAQIITIDGPAGSGKSTAAEAVAKHLGGICLNSGSVYRILTVLYIRRKALQPSLTVEDFAESLNEMTDIAITDGVATHAFGRPIRMTELKTREVNIEISPVSSNPRVRKWVNRRLHQYANFMIKNFFVTIVCEGRDAGTVIFPEAAHKFYLTAHVDIRAARIGETPEQVTTRDEIDHGKLVGKLIRESQARALGYSIINSSDLDIEEVVDLIFLVIDGEFDELLRTLGKLPS